MRFLVAFSFAGEQRMKYVRPLAEALRKALGDGKVFLDEWFVHEIAGIGSANELREIYRNESHLIIPCISAEYGTKPWTQLEFDAIDGLILQFRKAGKNQLKRVLPLRVGEGDVPGIFENTIAPDLQEMTVEESVNLVLKRLKLIGANLPDDVASSRTGAEAAGVEGTASKSDRATEPAKESRIGQVYQRTISEMEKILKNSEGVREFIQRRLPNLLEGSAAGWTLAEEFTSAPRFRVKAILKEIKDGLEQGPGPSRQLYDALDQLSMLTGGFAVLAVNPEWVLSNRKEVDGGVVSYPGTGDPSRQGIGEEMAANLLEIVTAALMNTVARLEAVFGDPPGSEPQDRLLRYAPEVSKGPRAKDQNQLLKVHFIKYVLKEKYEESKLSDADYVDEQFQFVLDYMEHARNEDGRPYRALGEGFKELSARLKDDLGMADLLIVCPNRGDKARIFEERMSVVKFLQDIFERIAALRGLS